MNFNQILVDKIDELSFNPQDYLNTDIVVQKLMEVIFWIDSHNKTVQTFKEKSKEVLPERYQNLKIIE